MRKTPYMLVAIVCTAALVAGCNLPVQNTNATVQTAAAMTVQAQLTAMAPATNTPIPFPTIPPANTQVPVNTLVPVKTAVPASPTSSCDNADFIDDVTIDDGTVLDPGEAFTKTWRIKNVGTCSWTPSYALVFVSGSAMSGPAVQALSGNVNPGQTVDFSVNLTAPDSDADYTGNWGLRNAAGVIFAHFWVKVEVSTETFAVTSVKYNLATWDDSGHDSCPQVTAHITANGPGDVKYHWTRSDNPTTSSETLHFNSAGTKDVVYQWALGSSHNGEANWIGIYIDTPNHQDFGHKNFTIACVSP